VNLMLLFGLPLFFPAETNETDGQGSATRPFEVALLFLSIAAPIIATFGLAILCATMAGTSPMALDRATVEMVVTQTGVGIAWQVRMIALLVSLLMVLLSSRLSARRLRWATSLAGATSLASLAWSGHAAGGEGAARAIQLGSDIIHLLAGGIWISALAAFVLMMFRRRDQIAPADLLAAHGALERFSITGSFAVAAIVVTGVLNASMILGLAGIPQVPFTLYGQLLLFKLVLVGVMLALAAGNRFRLAPALKSSIGAGDSSSAIRSLRFSLVFEFSAGLAVLALVAWLGTLAPPLPAV
jgi:putative copper resistance protein D